MKPQERLHGNFEGLRSGRPYFLIVNVLDSISHRASLVFLGESRGDLTARNASQMILAFPTPESKHFSLIAGQYSHRRLRRLGTGDTACVRATLC